MSKEEGPRIYNLFPLLVGPIKDWPDHLSRIHTMGFNWIFVNAFHELMPSGSPYAIRDFYAVHSRLVNPAGTDPFEELRAFIKHAERLGMRVMMDLVISHTAIDSFLLREHPEWFRRHPDGELVYPLCRGHGEKAIWREVIALDHLHGENRQAHWDYWKEVIFFYRRLGFSGFRCDMAYSVPEGLWRFLMDQTRRIFPETLFVAETLGNSPEGILSLHRAGFNFIFNSSKWWNFRDLWCLRQQEVYSPFIPSISFPERHDTIRLAAALDSDKLGVEFHYLFAAAFSTGVMIPFGFEFGFKKKLDFFTSSPDDWEEPQFDMQAFIAQTNRMKASCPALNQEGRWQRLSSSEDPLVILHKLSSDGRSGVLMLMNPDPTEAYDRGCSELLQQLGCMPQQLKDITPRHLSPTLPNTLRLCLKPWELKLLAIS